MSIFLVSLAVLSYVGLLFILARWGENSAAQKPWFRRCQPFIYSMALAVYCTSWTFYGSVGTAAAQGWNFLPILMGPAALFLLAASFIQKLVLVSKRQNVSSIADFLASRYGKKQSIAVIVTLIAFLATIPYIALQLKAVTLSFHALTGSDPERPAFVQQHTGLVVTVLMASFAIIFGTKKLDVTEFQPGVVLAIAFESLVKMFALLAAGLLAIELYFGSVSELMRAMVTEPQLRAVFNTGNLGASFVTQLVLSMAAVVCLPRQFFISVVQNQDIKHLNWARWIFPAYLLLISLLIVPIAAAGIILFGGSRFDADTYVLQLPLYFQSPGVALLVFIGGFSAATAMIIVATIALSTMISNDVVLPMLINKRYQHKSQQQNFSLVLLNIRRLSVVLVLTCAYFYHVAFADFTALTSIGLLTFALVVQFAPGLVGGLFWKTAHANGFKCGLLVGVLLWFITLMVPVLVDAGFLGQSILRVGLFGYSWLQPESLLMGADLDRLSHGVLVSLVFNTLTYVVVSSYSSPRLVDRIQASAFVNPVATEGFVTPVNRSSPLRTTDLRVMLEQFLGPARTYQLFEDFANQQQVTIDDESSPNYRLIEYCERLLAGAIGGASARAMMNSLLEGKNFGLEEIVNVLDETAHALQHNQSILHASLENIEQGISVVDKYQRLVAWNTPYVKLFNYPVGSMQVGTPIAELIRHNAESGLCGEGAIEEHIRKRIRHLKLGVPHRYQRLHQDGRVLEMWGNPLPDGGYVTTFTDITEHTRDKEALREAKLNLEQRVQERTETISLMNAELLREIDNRRAVEAEVQQAREIAETANADKTRFLALASHDILQPLNAARLYSSALQENPDSEDRMTVIANLSDSLTSTEALIASLLEIARLDDGAIVPSLEVFDIAEVLGPLINEFRTLANQQNTRLRAVPFHCIVHSDKLYLRRIIQNLISNAIKYAQQGQVLVGCRRTHDGLLLQVLDTGSGIPKDKQELIFNDFYRLKQHQQKVKGAGLGLGVVSRLCKLLELPVKLESEVGQYTQVSIMVPYGKRPRPLMGAGSGYSEPRNTEVAGSEINDMRVFCVDDEYGNLDALKRLLSKWNCQMETAVSSEEAMAKARQLPVPDVILMDYHLNDDYNGLALIQRLRVIWQKDIAAAIVTASHDPEVHAQVQENGIQLLHKPLRPAALKALLRHFKSLV